MGVTLAIFHSKGTVALIMAILKIFVNEFVITGAAMRIILAGILSIPVDLRIDGQRRPSIRRDVDGEI